MSNVPNNFVFGRIKHVMQGDGQFDHAQARAEMAAGFGDGRNGFLPQLVGQLHKLRIAEPLHVGGRFHLVQQGCIRAV